MPSNNKRCNLHLMEHVMSLKDKSYTEILGNPKELNRRDLNMNIAVVERVSQPFYEWFYEAVEGTEYEEYLRTRIAEMGDYLVLCYEEMEKRKEHKSDVKEAYLEEGDTCESTQHT